MRKTWTEEEIEFLKEFYPTEGPSLCAEVLDRTRVSIKKKAAAMGIKLIDKYNERRSSHEDYVKLVEDDYEVLEPYINTRTKILHRHKTCGHEWKSTPASIKANRSCPNCCIGNFRRNVPSSVYLIHFPILGLHKVGITNNWERRKHEFGYTPELILLREFETLEEAEELERTWLNNMSEYMLNTGELKAGNTETFYIG